MKYFSSPYKRSQFALLALDVILVLGVLLLGVKLYPYDLRHIVMLVWPAAVVLSLFVGGGYDLKPVGHSGYHVLSLLGSLTIAAFATYPFLAGPDRQRVVFISVLGVSAVLGLYLLRWVRRSLFGGLPGRRANFVLSRDAYLARLEAARDAIELHCSIGSVVKLGSDSSANARRVEELLEEPADLIVFEPSDRLSESTANQLIGAAVSGAKPLDFLEFYSSVTGRLPVDLVDSRWLLLNGFSSREASHLHRTRRIASFFVALGLLVLAAPVMCLIAIAILVDSGTPVLFRQERLGLFRRPFTLFKFRSMAVGAEKDGPRWAQADDPRVTRLGRLLRKAHLDELPQLVNLLRGDVRLIGPRPIREQFADELRRRNRFYDLRFLYHPGVTGWPQVLGPYGSTEDEQLIKLEMDLYYFQNSTFLGDIYVLLKTVQKVLFGRGV